MADGEWPFDDQCVLRLPEDVAEKLHAALEPDAMDASSLPVSVKPSADKSRRDRFFTVSAFGEELQGIMVDLPCYSETLKTADGVHFYKSADVSQMLLCYREDDPPREVRALLSEGHFRYPHGLTPATKRVRQRRFMRDSVFTQAEIREAEDAICSVMNGEEITLLEEDEVTYEEYLAHKQRHLDVPDPNESIWSPPAPESSQAAEEPPRKRKERDNRKKRQTQLEAILGDDESGSDEGSSHVASKVSEGAAPSKARTIWELRDYACGV